MGSWLSKEVVYFPHNLSRKGVQGKKPSSSSGSAKDSKSLAQSSLGISSPMRDKKVSSSANIMVPFSFLSYNLHNSTKSSNGRNFFSTSSVWPYLTQTFLVRFMPMA